VEGGVTTHEPLERDTFADVIDAWSPATAEAARRALAEGRLVPAVEARPLRDPAEALRRLRTPLFARGEP
jgi:hypothetical protein